MTTKMTFHVIFFFLNECSRNAGPKAHKYVRALYHALSRARRLALDECIADTPRPNDVDRALAGLEHYSGMSRFTAIRGQEYFIHLSSKSYSILFDGNSE